MKVLSFAAISVISILSFSSAILAEDIALPVISRPAALEEGLQKDLTAEQVAELLPWAKDSKNFLVDLLDNVQGLSTTDKTERLVEGINQVVIASAAKNSELLMRYALNRALVVNEILDGQQVPDSVGSADAKLRVLTLSIKMALKYYDADMEKLSRKADSPYALFGIDYFRFLNELNKSIFDASAQYSIQRTSLEWLQWDFYRDLNNARYASQILKINNALKTFPVKKMSDFQSISFIRQMKKVADQLNVLEKTVEPPVEVKPAPKVIEEKPKKKKGSFVSVYSSYYSTNYCYPADSNGRKLGDSQVDISNCQDGYASMYSSYYSTNYCYPVDSNGKKLGDKQADISKCQKGYVSLYSSYYSTNYCYPADKNGKKLGDNKVDISLCQ